MRTSRAWARLAVLACGVALTLLNSPAHAVATFGPSRPLPALDAHCRGTVLAAGAALRAFGTCDHIDDQGVDEHDQLAFFELTADGWHGRKLGGYGRPLAAAQDSTGTYLLYESHTPPGARDAAVLKRDNAGHYSTRVVHREESVGSADIVAADGSWWAVWTCVRGSGREYSLCESGTMYGATASRTITPDNAGDFYPSLARRADGRLDLLWSRDTLSVDGDENDIWLATRTTSGWRQRLLATRPNEPLVGQVATDGRHTYAAWIQDGRPVVGSDESGRWRTHAFVTRSCAQNVHLGVSRGAVLVAVNQCAEGEIGDDPSGSAVTLLERRDGRWSSARLASSPNPNGLRAGAVVSQSGRATVLLGAAYAGTFTRTQYAG